MSAVCTLQMSSMARISSLTRAFALTNPTQVGSIKQLIDPWGWPHHACLLLGKLLLENMHSRAPDVSIVLPRSENDVVLLKLVGVIRRIVHSTQSLRNAVGQHIQSITGFLRKKKGQAMTCHSWKVGRG